MTQNMDYMIRNLNSIMNNPEMMKDEVIKKQAGEMQDHLKTMSDQMQAMMTNLQNMSQQMQKTQTKQWGGHIVTGAVLCAALRG
jgi:DNA anti-recombination protein RmuC